MATESPKSDPRVFDAIKHALDLDSKGETALAIQHLSAFIEELPSVGSLHGYLALLLVGTGQFDQAIEHGRQAVLLSPESEKLSFFYCNALWNAGKRVEALEEIKRFLIIKPSSKIYSQMIKEWDLSKG